jgi:ribonuclease-3
MTNFNDLKNSFKDKKLFDLSLTHRSWVNENPKIRGSNERLEFLGDAVLEFIVSKTLFQNFPNKEEGFLTALRAKIVNTVSLSEVAKKLELGNYLYLSKGEEETGGRENISLLADTVEAIIGALYIDQGIDGSEKFIKDNLLLKLDQLASEPLKDAKSMLQEIVQAKGFAAPKYQVVDEEGPDHAKKFTIEVLINGTAKGKGSGKNKSEAAQNAAQDALSKLL